MKREKVPASPPHDLPLRRPPRPTARPAGAVQRLADRGRSELLEHVDELDSGQRRVLVALRQVGAVVPDAGIDRRRLALLTKYTARGGRFGNILGALRSRGLLEGSDAIRLTTSGAALTSSVPPLPTGRALLEDWMHKLPKASRDILGELASVYPRKLTPEAIASRIGREASGGSFGNGLGRLRTLPPRARQARARRRGAELFDAPTMERARA